MLDSPLGIHTNHSWQDIGLLMALSTGNNCMMFIETDVDKGGLASIMISKSLWVDTFRYIGICPNDALLDKRVRIALKNAPTSQVMPGVCHSDSLRNLLRNIIDHSAYPVHVHCSSGDISRSFTQYVEFLRPGDIITAHRFPVGFSLSIPQKFMDDGKMKRIVINGGGTSLLFAGKIV